MSNTFTQYPADVVFLSPTLSGGLGKVTIKLAETMFDRGFSVEIWVLNNNDQTAVNNKVLIRSVPGRRASSALFKLSKMLQKRKPLNVLSASFHINCITILAKFISRVSSRLIIAEHTSLENGLETLHWTKKTIARFSIAILYRFSDAVIAVSNDAARQVEKYAFLAENSVKTIYNPVIDDAIFRASKKEFTHPFSKVDEKIFLSVGRLSKEKDIPTLIKAFAESLKIKPSRLIIVGDGPERQSILKLIKSLGLTEQIALLGHLTNPYPLFRQSNVLVLSSTREGLPTVLIEALALGCIIVSTDVRSGPREILEDGRLGFLVPPSDAEALASAMVESLNLNDKSLNNPHASLGKYCVSYATDQYVTCLSLKRETT